jgi:hypothetical protein
MEVKNYPSNKWLGLSIAPVVSVLALMIHSPAASAVNYTDVTAASGISFIQHNLPDSPSFPFEPDYMSGAAAAGDFDGDGWVDLYVTRLDAADLLYRNQGDGTFVDVAAAAGIVREVGSNGAAWGDIDNDGDLDLYVTTLLDSRFYLYLNDGAGNFSEQAVARGAALERPDFHVGYSVTFGDYDLDGYLDIHTTEWRASVGDGTLSNSKLLRNKGALQPGFFEDVTIIAGLDVHSIYAFASRFSDLDLDGFPDLLIAGDFGTSRLFWNNGDGTFTDGTVAAGVGTDENGMGSALADYDGDGLLDWFVTSIYDPADTCATEACNWGGSGNRLYRNNGDRTFSDTTDVAGVRDGAWGWGTTFLDHDNDGDQDLVMTNGVNFPNEATFALDDPFENDVMRVWDNDGAGSFTEWGAAVGLTDTGSGKGLLSFDYDRDGDLDLFIVNNGALPVLYRNDGGNANDWLRVVCAGSQPCLGAKIKVLSNTGAAQQTAELNAGSNFLGQNEMVAHFGLGASQPTPINSVSITWPQGQIQNMTGLDRNSTLSIVVPLALVGDETNNILYGMEGWDSLEGRGGSDLLTGLGGNDALLGGDGLDIIDGGEGDDALNGGDGDDILILNTLDASTGLDFYDGGIGLDTLLLALTAAELADAAVAAELDAFAAFLLVNSNETIDSNPEFTFSSLGLTVRNIEILQVTVPGSGPGC